MQNVVQALARNIASTIVSNVTKATGEDSHFSRLFSAVKAGRSSSLPLKDVFHELQQYDGFETHEMVDIPGRLKSIPCPKGTAVELSIHANHVSMGHGRQAIAAMPPKCVKGEHAKDLYAFYQLLADAPNTVVMDLRTEGDFDKGSFDYCPELNRSCVLRANRGRGEIWVTTLAVKTLRDAHCKELTLEIELAGKPPQHVRVLQFSNWPDRDVISPAQLRTLRGLAAAPLANHQQLIAHGRIGGGRTGTLLSYTNLHHDLIEKGRGRELFNSNGVLNKNKLLEEVTRVVALGRLERGPHFVQTPDQFKLLYNTVKEDLLNHACELLALPPSEPSAPATTVSAPTPVTVTTPPPEPAPAPEPAPEPAPAPAIVPIHVTERVVLPTKQIGLAGNTPSQLMPEPKNKESRFQHWAAILEKGDNALEIISDPRRWTAPAWQSNSGLGALLNDMRSSVVAGGHIQDYQFGDKQVVSVRLLKPAKMSEEMPLVRTQEFEIHYKTIGDTAIKKLTYAQILTPFDGKKLSAKQLDEIVEFLNRTGNTGAKWLTSVKGVGRPSAILVAQAIQTSIANGSITDEASLIEKLDAWIAQGRSTAGHLFINSRQQKQQLLELGKVWLASSPSKQRTQPYLPTPLG